jgi:hypothetical protein
MEELLSLITKQNELEDAYFEVSMTEIKSKPMSKEWVIEFDEKENKEKTIKKEQSEIFLKLQTFGSTWMSINGVVCSEVFGGLLYNRGNSFIFTQNTNFEKEIEEQELSASICGYSKIIVKKLNKGE